MKTVLWRVFWPSLALIRAALWIAFALLVGALVFLLFTRSGAQLALRAAGTLSKGMVVVDGVDGTLWGPLQFAHLKIVLPAVDIELDKVEIDIDLRQLARRRVEIEQLHAAQLLVVVKPTAPQPPVAPSPAAITRLPVALAVRDASVGMLSIDGGSGAPMVFGDVRLAATWVGDRVVLEQLAATTPWVGHVRLDGVATLKPDAIELQPLHAEGFAVASLDGRFGYGTPSALHLQWQKIVWPPASAVDVQTQFDSGGGEAHWRGLLDDYQFDLAGAVALPQLAIALKAKGSGSLSAIHVAQLDAQALGGQLQAQADLGWNGGLRIDGAGRFSGIQPDRVIAELPGVLNGRFDASTTMVEGQPAVRFDAQLSDSKLRGYPLALEARGQYAATVLNFDSLRVQSGTAVVAAKGQILPSLNAQADVDARNLGDAWPDLRGSLRGQLRAQGPLRLPHVAGTLRAEGLGYGTLQLRSLRLQADVDPARQLDLDLDLRDADLGIAVPGASLAIHGPVQAHDIRLQAKTAQGAVELAAHGALDIETLGWRGELRSGRLAPNELAPWVLNQPTALVVAAGDLALDPMCWSAAGARACVSIKREGGGRRIDFALADLALAYLKPALPSGADIDVVVQASGYTVLGPAGVEQLHADVATGDGRWQLGGLPPVELKPASLSIDEQGSAGMKIALNLPFASGEIAADALLAPGAVLTDRSLSGELRVDMPDLSWLRLVTTEITRAEGHVAGRLQLGGTPANTQLHGRIALSDGGFALVTPGIVLREVGVRVDTDAAGDLRFDGEASSGDGKLQLSGTASPRADPLKLDLRLRGDDFQTMKTSEARISVSPDLHIALGDSKLAVDGTITVPKADITPKSLGDGSVSASGDEVLVGNDPGAQRKRDLRIAADITLKLGDEVRFEGFGLKSRLRGSVEMLEQPGVTTRARGEIRLVDGHYKAYGQDLTVETGKLIFSGGPVTEPALEVRATRKPTDEVTVGLYVRGTLRKPDLQLFSTPPMPQQQQLAWLVLGRPLNDSTSSSEDKSMVGNAATSLGLAGGEWIAQQLGNKIGIDEISVGAKPGQTNQQAMFTVGKYLSPKLFLSYGIGLFQPGSTFRIQYDLGRGFKARTETGVESGGDLLYTIERK